MAHTTNPSGYRRALASVIGRAGRKNKKNYGRPSYGKLGPNRPKARAYSHDAITALIKKK